MHTRKIQINSGKLYDEMKNNLFQLCIMYVVSFCYLKVFLINFPIKLHTG